MHPQLTASVLVQSLVKARGIDTAWKQLADIQQAGLDAALAAQCKARNSQPPKSAPAVIEATGSGAQPQSYDSNGNTEGSSVLPDQETASVAGAGQAGEGPEASDLGLPASEENQAANRQMSASANLPATSMGKEQVRLPMLVCMIRWCNVAQGV